MSDIDLLTPVEIEQAEHGYMDGYLEEQTLTIRALIKDNFDVVVVLDGREGGGKTTMAGQLCKEIDPTFDLSRIVFDAEEFFKLANTLQPGQALLMDESMNVLFSRAAMSGTNISMVRLLAMCRAKRLFICLVIPSFFEMDKYAAMHRSNALIHIYTTPKKSGARGVERGYFRWYDYNAKLKLYMDGKKGMDYGVAKATFFGRFDKTWVVDEEAYNEKKLAALKHMEEMANKKSMTNKRVELWKNKLKQVFGLYRDDMQMPSQEFLEYLRGRGVHLEKSEVVGEIDGTRD